MSEPINAEQVFLHERTVGPQQVDWRLAPSDADAWAMTEFGCACWIKEVVLSLAPDPGTIAGAVVVCAAPNFGHVLPVRYARPNAGLATN